MEKFAIGLIIGGVCGALLASNNHKMRTLIRKSQEEVQTKLDELMDEKIRNMEENVEKAADKVEEMFDGDDKKKKSAKA